MCLFVWMRVRQRDVWKAQRFPPALPDLIVACVRSLPAKWLCERIHAWRGGVRASERERERERTAQIVCAKNHWHREKKRGLGGLRSSSYSTTSSAFSCTEDDCSAATSLSFSLSSFMFAPPCAVCGAGVSSCVDFVGSYKRDYFESQCVFECVHSVCGGDWSEDAREKGSNCPSAH